MEIIFFTICNFKQDSCSLCSRLHFMSEITCIAVMVGISAKVARIECGKDFLKSKC